MKSAVFEADESDTFVGASYLYATPRDWARFGQLLLQDGKWNGEQLLPKGFAAMMHTPAPASHGAYGRGQLWLLGPGLDPLYERTVGVPPDTYWLLGHDGQSIAVVPSKKLVIVRMGLTPDKLSYRPQELVAALAKQP
jgi:CubicO group peptidase (beta-lactamase class C family)